MPPPSKRRALPLASALAIAVTTSNLYGVTTSQAQVAAPATAKSSAEARARQLAAQMTLNEKIALVHGPMAMPIGPWTAPEGAIGSAGYIAGVPRLGIPPLQESDASLGVTNPANVRPGDSATALPSGLALAATFNPALVFDGGVVVGREARAKGFNVQLAGGVNLVRDPRNGRNFEYMGEDPWLAGVLTGESIRGIQSNKIISTIKHFAVNDSETNRNWSNSVIDEAAMRESDLLAFQIAIERGNPLSVMCGYNLVNGDYACGSDFLLNTVLKTDWKYKGFVMSDWGAVKSEDFALKGLDQQSGEQLDEKVWFGAPLKAAVESGRVSPARLTNMVERILYAHIASGAFDAPPVPGGVYDAQAHALVSQHAAEEGIVLLKNEGALLPLAATAKTILVVGNFVDKGVPSGGGSSNVTSAPGQTAIPVSAEGMFADFLREQYHPSSPLKAIRAKAPMATVLFDNGRYPAEAARKAAKADLVVVFGTQWMTEVWDAPNMDLPQGQSETIAEVLKANKKTVVVLQTGGAVNMPWLDQAPAVLEAWYAGGRGGEAIANVLFGDVNPSGRLPVTFPKSIKQTPRPEVLDGLDLPEKTQFDVTYHEGADVGYRWFAKTGEAPLFAFGHGLSYTRFAYSDVKVAGGKALTVSFTVTNTGQRAGKDAPQVYLTGTPDGQTLRLIGFDKVDLKPGESKTLTLSADPRLVGHYDSGKRQWRVKSGSYTVKIAASATDTGQTATTQLAAQTRVP